MVVSFSISNISQSNNTAFADRNSTSIVNTGDNANINIINGITPEQFSDGLKRREQEVRIEMELTHTEDKLKIRLLEKENEALKAKNQNSVEAFENYKAELAKSYKALDESKIEASPEQIIQAKVALKNGDIKFAKIIFQTNLLNNKKNASESAYQLGKLALSQIDYEEASRYFQEAVLLQPDNLLYLNDAGVHFSTIGNYKQAEEYLQKSLTIRRLNLEFNHPYIAIALNNLGVVYLDQKQYKKAEPLFLEALMIREDNFGYDHPEVTESIDNLSNLYIAQGAYFKAGSLKLKALKIYVENRGTNDIDVAITQNNIGSVYQKLKLYGEAEQMFNDSLNTRIKILGNDHPLVSVVHQNLFNLYLEQGQFAKAKPHFLKSCEMLRKYFSPSGNAKHCLQAKQLWKKSELRVKKIKD
jgi:tetratricopeptide (TPR) repeat protein